MTTTPLQQARALKLPAREAMLRRDASVHQFWAKNQELLRHAWDEWDNDGTDDLVRPDSSLLDPKLRAAVTQAWEDPTTESAVQELLEEVAPDVYHFQFFDPDRLADLRSYLEQLWDAEIPLRPPYGIVLNRRGAMLDPRSAGYLGAPSFQTFYRDLLDVYMRPISRLLFPEITGYDTQTFGFSINYQPTTDTSIRPHSDASSVTLNINVNLPGEEFTGSVVDFLDPATGEVTGLTFRPGTAMLHRGHVPHMAQPIVTGERTNLVLWLYGDNGHVPGPGTEPAAIDARERWSTPTAPLDNFAPF